MTKNAVTFTDRTNHYSLRRKGMEILKHLLKLQKSYN